MTLIFVGGGKYAGLLYAMFSEQENIVGFIDDIYPNAYVNQKYNLQFLGRSQDLGQLRQRYARAVIAIGSEGDLVARIRYFELLREHAFDCPRLVHPSAIVGAFSTLGIGTVVQYGATVHPAVRVGCNCVIATSAIVGHDSAVGDHSWVGPGAIINGSVDIGDAVFMGTGSIVIQKQKVGRNCMIAAAACVTKDVPDDAIVHRQHRLG